MRNSPARVLAIVAMASWAPCGCGTAPAAAGDLAPAPTGTSGSGNGSVERSGTALKPVPAGGHPESVLLETSTGFTCSGALVQTANAKVRNVILTARHCLKEKTKPSEPAEVFTKAYFGDSEGVEGDADSAQIFQQMKAVDVLTMSDLGLTALPEDDSGEPDGATASQPGGCPNVKPYNQSSSIFSAYDVLILELNYGISDVTPAMLTRQAPDVRSDCQVVGFGAHNKRSLDKHTIDVTITDVFAHMLFQGDTTNGTTGSGDSGGPLFCKVGAGAQTFVAGTVAASNVLCVANGTASYSRVDGVYDKIEAVMQGWNSGPKSVPTIAVLAK